MEYSDNYYFMDNDQQQGYYYEQECTPPKVEIQKKISKKKYQKALKWTHLASPFSENQTPEKFLLYGNVNLFTNYSEDSSKCPFTSECVVENGYYKLDRVLVQEKKGIEMQISPLKPSLDKFQFLINLYKRYQSSKYQDLANALLQYQKFIKQESDRSNSMYKQLKKDQSLQSRFQEEYYKFEQKIISEIHAQGVTSNSNQFYSYCTVAMNYKLGQPEMKKFGTSEPLTNLLGNSIQNEYHNLLWKMRKQQVFTKNQENHLFRSQESISKAIFMINKIINQEKSYTFSQTLMTRDGFEIPCTVKAEVISNQSLNYVKHYEARDQQVIHYTYTFNKNDMQLLINKRENMSQQTSTYSPQQFCLDMNLSLDCNDESQPSNFILEHTSETFSQLDFNNSVQQQQQPNQGYQSVFANNFKSSNQSFSPVSTATCSIQQYQTKITQMQACDYSKKCQLFVNKYYKNLIRKNIKVCQNSK